ncbi:MAG TPA: class II glutamine amidotransferase [Steroidobacteraceae bacterium]|nr:class II glutamine amidotransferase [Steroidobacteraceae bacterium]
MCELFGLSSSRPLSGQELPLGEFRSRGGATADNPDGWGIAWRGEAGFHIAKEPVPACGSAHCESLIEALRSDLVIAHVRKAKFPPVNTLNNTHPFLRECCGRHWSFAHNGLVPEIVAMETSNQNRVCRPDGDTDSEFAFCHLLSHVTQHIDELGAATDWLAVLGAVSDLIAERGKFNFLLSDGDYLIAYGHDRLHYLESSGDPDDVALIATEPLSGDAAWIPFAPGELRIYRAGRRAGRIAAPVPRIDSERTQA